MCTAWGINDDDIADHLTIAMESKTTGRLAASYKATDIIYVLLAKRLEQLPRAIHSRTHEGIC